MKNKLIIFEMWKNVFAVCLEIWCVLVAILNYGNMPFFYVAKILHFCTYNIAIQSCH